MTEAQAATDGLLRSLGLGHVDLTLVPSDDVYGSPFAVTTAAAASVATALGAVAAFDAERGGTDPTAVVDTRHAAVVFRSEQLLQAPQLPDAELWDPVTGNYRTADGWIRLHTNLPSHRAAALGVLGVEPEHEAVGKAVAEWAAPDLEHAVVHAGGVAAAMRTRIEWEAHEHHAAVLDDPLVGLATADDAPPAPWDAERALDSVRVLDLTRVIAGPVAGRFLASFGADVTRVDPPFPDSALLEIDTGLGKRRATIDLRRHDDRKRFEVLVRDADVVLESFRPGALAGIGYGDDVLRQLRPGLVIGHLSAYGNHGPWGDRRGFDSVVQVATGIAHRCGFDDDRGPGKLPAQALDHASGYLFAAGLVAALTRRLRERSASTVTVSLAGTGEWLWSLGVHDRDPQVFDETDVADLLEERDDTAWGTIRHIRAVGSLPARPARWQRPPMPRE